MGGAITAGVERFRGGEDGAAGGGGGGDAAEFTAGAGGTAATVRAAGDDDREIAGLVGWAVAVRIAASGRPITRKRRVQACVITQPRRRPVASRMEACSGVVSGAVRRWTR